MSAHQKKQFGPVTIGWKREFFYAWIPEWVYFHYGRIKYPGCDITQLRLYWTRRDRLIYQKT